MVSGQPLPLSISLRTGNFYRARIISDRLSVAVEGLRMAYRQFTAAAAILIWGIASFAIVPPLQMRVMDAAADAPNLASAMNIGALNLGNAIGAALGGGVIGAGLGLPVVSLAGAAMAVVALAMLLAFRRHPRIATCPV